ncbi:MAG TPA: peptide deformylase [Rhodospirillaceae bacterium]|nr:peptide deformylase [Rhodospirillaceae bacterium]HAA90954.1 peptide deformylase [Rhodospirillaceae bacterium]HAT35863.1 peptide deformylase [Rhodospirillaceae bacterium]
MAILKIARMGHPVLRQPAEPVMDPSAPRIQTLVRDMLETMQDADGTGLAAPQVHVPLRVVVFFVAGDRAAEQDGDDGALEVPLTVLINPSIEPLTEDKELDWEGCLSLPGLIGKVPRFSKIRYRATALDGSEIDEVAEGFHARVVQHECDHLDGVLYPQQMDDLSLLMFRDEMRYGVPGNDAGTEDDAGMSDD